MRLEPLCTITMRYTSGSWHHPYGRDVDSAQEGIGFGQGDGEVTGDIEGTTQWANYPRRREDGSGPQRSRRTDDQDPGTQNGAQQRQARNRPEAPGVEAPEENGVQARSTSFLTRRS